MTISIRIDLRIYDALTGKLKKVFNDLHDDKIVVDLTTFCFGANERKFYIADNGGFIRVYNMKNGEFMNKVNLTTEIEGVEFANKHAHIKKKENNEVSNMIYLREERLLIMASWDSTIRIYDESEPEESVLLRVFSGGHMESEILSLAYSSHLSLLASGSSNGIIAVWDLETGKLETLLLGHKNDINALEFAHPYPLLISGSNEGVICIWGVRPIIQKYKYICLLKIVNSVIENNEEKDISITSLISHTEISLGIPRSKLITKYFPTSTVLEVNESEENNPRKTSQAFSKKKKMKKNKEEENSFDNVTDYFETNEDWEQYFKQDELDLPLTKRRCYILCGDAKGFMFLLNLTEFLKKRNIVECEKSKKAQTYQLRRKDLINATKQVEIFMQNEMQQNEKPGKRREIQKVHAYNTLLFNKWEAHVSQVNKITKIKDPLSFITCSLDKHVKVWSLSGELLGDINLVKLGNNYWKFPFDWVKNKLSEIDDVFETLEKIEKERLSENQKNEIKTNFLISKYLSDNIEFFNLKNAEEQPLSAMSSTNKPAHSSGENKFGESLLLNKSQSAQKPLSNHTILNQNFFEKNLVEEKLRKKINAEAENLDREMEREKKSNFLNIYIKLFKILFVCSRKLRRS